MPPIFNLIQLHQSDSRELLKYSYSAAQLEQVGLSAFVKGTTGEVWFFFPGEQGGCSSVPPVHSWGDTFQSQADIFTLESQRKTFCLFYFRIEVDSYKILTQVHRERWIS